MWFHKPNMRKDLSHSGREGNLLQFTSVPHHGLETGPKCLPVLYVAAQGLHTYRDGTNGEVGPDSWV